jgi:hypothetical protein
MSNPIIEMLGRFPWTAGAVLSLALVFAFGTWLAADRRLLAQQRAGVVDRLTMEFTGTEMSAGRWSMETMTGNRETAGRVEEQLGRWRESMAGDFPGGGAAPEPRDRSEAFFALDAFRVRMRARAVELGVGLREGEAFGFAGHVHEGPETRFIGAVHRQSQVVEFLLNALFQEPPVELRSVQRERPAGGRVDDLGAGGAGGMSPDFFVIGPRLSARVPGLVEGTAVRLVFVGRTATLRSFMAGIGGYGLPLIVRSVEVEGAGPLKTGVKPRDGDDWDDLSQFTVIVEQLKLVRAKP